MSHAKGPAGGHAPGKLRLKVASDGTPEGTQVLDADRGLPLEFAAVMSADVESGPGGDKAKIVLTFHNVPVEVSGQPGPFILQGLTVGAEQAPPEAVAAPPRARNVGPAPGGALGGG